MDAILTLPGSANEVYDVITLRRGFAVSPSGTYLLITQGTTTSRNLHLKYPFG